MTGEMTELVDAIGAKLGYDYETALTLATELAREVQARTLVRAGACFFGSLVLSGLSLWFMKRARANAAFSDERSDWGVGACIAAVILFGVGLTYAMDYAAPILYLIGK